jgi:hypothetical protein
MVLTMGDFSTLITPTVTSALNYDMLIGNDVLFRARAVIDYHRLKMSLQVDPTYRQELDINPLPTDEAACYTLQDLQGSSNSSSGDNISRGSSGTTDPRELQALGSIPEEGPCCAASSELPADTHTSPAASLPAMLYLEETRTMEWDEPTQPNAAPSAVATCGDSAHSMTTVEEADDDSLSLCSAGFSDLTGAHTEEEPSTEDSEWLAPSQLRYMMENLQAAYPHVDNSTAHLLATLDAIALHQELSRGNPAGSPEEDAADDAAELLFFEELPAPEAYSHTPSAAAASAAAPAAWQPWACMDKMLWPDAWCTPVGAQ